MVTAALRSVFAQETPEEIESRWDDLATSLAERTTTAASLMNEARGDMLAHFCGEGFAYLHFRQEY